MNTPNPNRVEVRKGVHLVRRGGRWYLETCAHGVQERKALGTGDYNEAYRRVMLAPPSDPQAALPPEQPKRTTMADLYNAYDKEYRESFRASSARRELPVVKTFVDFVGREKDVRRLSHEEINAFLEKRKGIVSDHTRYNDYNRVKGFINWARRPAGKRPPYLTVDLMSGVRVPERPNAPKEAPSTEEVKAAIRAHQGSWLGDFFAILCETGMRPSELLALRGLSIKDEVVRIESWGTFKLKTKKSERTLQVSDTAARILKDRIGTLFDKSLPVFHGRLGNIRNEFKVSEQFHKKLPETLHGRVTLYSGRHYFASEHSAPGPNYWPQEQLASYLGHSSSAMLDRWYSDDRAKRRGKPSSLLVEQEGGGKVVGMKNASG